MSHCFCIGCSAIISCGWGECSRCRDKTKPSARADSAGFIGFCDECFDALPPGTKSEYVEMYERELAEAKDELGYLERQANEIQKRFKEKRERVAIMEKALAEYPNKGVKQPPEPEREEEKKEG